MHDEQVAVPFVNSHFSSLCVCVSRILIHCVRVYRTMCLCDSTSAAVSDDMH